MNIEQYKINAAKTMSNQWHLSIFDTEELHCAIGIVTEFGELMQAVQNPVGLDRVNVLEEIGDVLWYLAGFQRRYSDLDWEETERLGYNDITTLVKVGTIEAIELLDMYKKFAYYGKPLDPTKIKSECYFIYRACRDILLNMGYTIEECRQINIDKLKKRFPNEFTTEDAITRDLDSERKILEGESGTRK